MTPSTRIFDVLGILSVIAWITILCAFGYQEWSKQQLEGQGAALIGEEGAAPLALSEGNAWLVLRRDDEEIGYIHESRTKVDNNWLFEHEMVMLIEIGGMEQWVDTHTRATLDANGYLEKFQGDITSFMGTFTAKGEVQPDAIAIEIDLGRTGQHMSRKVALSEPPRLANTALNQLVARPEKLVVGQRYEREYFDPMQQQMSTISYRYLEEREIDLYDTKRLAYHFEQEIMGEELDVYVSPDGEILIQEFPMRTVASLLPEELGKTHVSGLKRDLRLRERTSKSKNDASKQDGAPIVDPSIDPNKLGLQGALQSLSSMIAPRPDASPDEPDMAVDMTRDPPDAAPDGDASAPPSP